MPVHHLPAAAGRTTIASSSREARTWCNSPIPLRASASASSSKKGVALGPGKADLLEAIRDTHSLTAAANRFGMSYKRGWTLVRELNAAFASPLVETEKGGAGGGGGARLTALGEHVLARYRQMEADAGQAIEAGVADLRKLLKAARRRKPAD